MPEQDRNEQIDRGRLMVQVNSTTGAKPIADARVEISFTGDPESVVETIEADENGQTENVELAAPPVEYSLSPGENQPYAE